jgi:CcmD family protein
VSNLAWLFVAVMIVWLAIGGYLVTLSVRQRKIEARIGQLSNGDDKR